MIIEYIIEDTNKKLTEEMQSELLGDIPKRFDNWDEARTTQKTDTEIIKEELYFKKKLLKEKSWKSHTSLASLYELAQTFKAHIWESTYQSIESMFDVSGRDENSESHAASQKALLVNAFEDMKIGTELDKAINNLIETGDSVIFVGWEVIKKQIRRLNETQITKEEKTIFDGVKVKSIDPLFFVFDASKKDNWDSCPKIYRSWATYNEIIDNKIYQIDNTTKDVLKNLGSKNDSTGDSLQQDFEDKESKATKGDQIELLEYWGDIKLNDGTLLRNWLVTIAGRSKIIRFEVNPYEINPFIYANLIEDPNTRRGISPLRVALVFNDISSDIMNRQLDALSLIMNPPYLAPKGCFSGKQEVSPGKIIEYDAALMPQAPVPIRFDNALKGWDFIQFFKNEVESTTGIFQNMSGQLNDQQRTATELNYTVSGQSTRLLLIVDNINQRIIVPMVELVAELLASFKYEPENILVNKYGNNQTLQIDNIVRQANYKYTYGDKKKINERKQKFSELINLMKEFAQNPEVAMKIDWMECFKYALEQYGIENPENYLKKDINLQNEQYQPQVGINPATANSGAINIQPNALSGLDLSRGISQRQNM